MKSHINRKNTYWIFLATIFGLVFPSNWTSNYRNFIGLLFCLELYFISFAYNNHQVEKQEQQEKEKCQRYIGEKQNKEQKQQAKKEKQKEEYNQIFIYPQIISYLLAKYKRDWKTNEKINKKYLIKQLNNKKREKLKYPQKNIEICQSVIVELERLKGLTKNQYTKKQEELNHKIEIQLSHIRSYQQQIIQINKDYLQDLKQCQFEIHHIIIQYKTYEKKANELLENSPKILIDAIDYYLTTPHNLEENKYLLQARTDAENKIKKEN